MRKPILTLAALLLLAAAHSPEAIGCTTACAASRDITVAANPPLKLDAWRALRLIRSFTRAS